MIAPLAGYGGSMPEAGVQQGSSSRSGDGDVFVRGEWWANGSVARNEGQRSEAGQPVSGQPTPYGVRAYQRQLQSGQGPEGEVGVEASQGEAENNSAVTGSDAAAGETEKSPATEKNNAAQGQVRKQDGTALSDAEMQEVALLQKIDTRVRAHEMAHLAVAGGYARGGASFQYRRGPDGRNYAVGGEVPIDVSEETSPQTTINKMQTVKAAALAPADPSPQDRKVAAAAVATMSEARQELRLEKIAELASRQEQAAAAAFESESNPAGEDGPSGTFSKAAGVEEKGRRQLINAYFKPGGVAKTGFATVV